GPSAEQRPTRRNRAPSRRSSSTSTRPSASTVAPAISPGRPRRTGGYRGTSRRWAHGSTTSSRAWAAETALPGRERRLEQREELLVRLAQADRESEVAGKADPGAVADQDAFSHQARAQAGSVRDGHQQEVRVRGR